MAWPHEIQYSDRAHYCDESNDEAVLDTYGRKHVNTDDNADGLYLLQNDTETVHTFFSTPGVESANALRQFLGVCLPEESVVNEYGYVVPIADISDDHLPKLQAQLWLSETEKSRKPLLSLPNDNAELRVHASIVQRCANSAKSSPQKKSTREDLLRIACHITFIAELLQGMFESIVDQQLLTTSANHIFICSNKTNGACELFSCPSRSNALPHSSPIATMEPLIHWATVTPATNLSPSHNRMQIFRRDGEKCADPLWTQAIMKFTPQHATSYCLECLRMMMEKRTAALQAMERQKLGSFTAVNSAPALKVQGRQIKPYSVSEVRYKPVSSLGYRRTSSVDKDRDGRSSRDYDIAVS